MSNPDRSGVSSVQVDVETKFMQNYRVASPVHGGSEVAAIAGSTGEVELFTVGSDSSVWNFYPDPTSATGYSSAPTGLHAAAIAAGVDSSGDIVVLAASGLQLSYVVETGAATSRWSAPQSVSVPPLLNATKIARIVTRQIGGRLYVGVLTQYASALGSLYSFSYSAWNPSLPALIKTSMNLSSTNCAWLGNTAENAAFACVDGVIVSYVVSTGQVVRYPMTAAFTSISVDTALDSAGNNQIVAVLSDGNLYHLVGGQNNQPYSWAQLSQAMTFRQVEADTDATGAVHIFSVSGSNRLYHIQQQSQSTTGYSYPPSPIYSNVSVLGVATNDAGALDLFAVGTGQSALTHLFVEEVSSNWMAEAVEVTTTGSVEEYISYTSDVTVYDGQGALLANSPANVWSPEETRISVNGATFFVGPNKPARMSTNGAGVLSISQETGSLAIPTVEFNVPALMAPGDSIAVEQSAGVQQRLAQVTGPALMDAQDSSGYLLSEQYRTPETTDSLASAFNKCMQLAGAPPTAHLTMFRRHGPKVGVWSRTEESPPSRRLISGGEDQHWSLTFAEGRVIHRSLTAAEAAGLIAEKRASIESAAGLFDWLEDIGDFVEGVVEGIVDVIDTVVTTVAQGIQAVFTIVVDGVQYLFEQVITFVEQAFDVVEAFFAQVAVFFEQVFEWLGFLFDWPDMLRTHEALAYTIDQFLTFLQGAAGGVQRLVDNGIGTLQQQVANIFQRGIQDIAGSASVGGYDKNNETPSPAFASAVSNNVVFNGLLNNAGGAIGVSTLAATDSDPLDQFMQRITEFARNTRTTAAFESAASYFKNLGGSLDEIFDQLLAAMFEVIEGLVQAVLAGTQAIVDQMLQLIENLVAILQNVLNEAWNIPFVSDLYSWLTNGSELTTLDLIALIAAVPTTILYKVIFGSAPFPDETSVTAFKGLFNATTMLEASGLGATTTDAIVGRPDGLGASTDGGLLPKPAADLVAVGGFVTSFFYGGISAVLDGLPTSPPVLSKAAFVCEAGAHVCSFPWFTSSGSPDCATPEGGGRTEWIYGTLGVLLDALFVGMEGKIPESANDVGVVIAFVYGSCHLPLAIVACAGDSGLAVAGEIVPVIPELAKLLRFSGIVEATSGVSLPVLAGIDAVFMTTSAIIGFVLATSETAELVAATV